MFSSPLVAPLDCNPEAKALIAAGLLRASPPPLAGGSFSDLRQALREWRPHIFWFAGSGTPRVLLARCPSAPAFRSRVGGGYISSDHFHA
jgi:hypothetical protein